MKDYSPLSLMKPDAILISTSRGQIIDEEALVAHCRTYHHRRFCPESGRTARGDNRSMIDPRHAHDFPHLVKIEAGNGVLTDETGLDHPLQKGDCVFI